MTTGRRGRYTDHDIQWEIQRLTLEGVPPAEIHRHLAQRGSFAGRCPNLRTVQRIAADYTPRDTSIAWGLGDAADDDAALILPVLAAVIEQTGGRVSLLTKCQATWLLKIRRAVPGLSPWWAFRLTVSYMVRAHRDEPTSDLDELLAFTPWRSTEHFDRFFHMVKTVHPGWIQFTDTPYEPAQDATPEGMRVALGLPLKIAEGLYLAMEMQKKEADNDEAS